MAGRTSMLSRYTAGLDCQTARLLEGSRSRGIALGCRATRLMAGQRHDRMAGLADRRLGVARP
jgi:hypothetical protein